MLKVHLITILPRFTTVRSSLQMEAAIIGDAPTNVRHILHITEAECLFNLLKERKTLTVGGGLSCHSFLRRLMFLSSVFFPVRVDSAGFIGTAWCVSRAAFLARTLVFGLVRGGGRATRCKPLRTRRGSAPHRDQVAQENEVLRLYNLYQKKIRLNLPK